LKGGAQLSDGFNVGHVAQGRLQAKFLGATLFLALVLMIRTQAYNRNTVVVSSAGRILVLKWRRLMQQLLNMFGVAVIALAAAFPVAARAQSCVDGYDDTISFVANNQLFKIKKIVSYTALISKRDLFNSHGARLHSFAAVLQQDRANLHRTGLADVSGDWHDESDAYFTTQKRRSFLSSARYYMPCYFKGDDAKQFKSEIVNGNVLGVVGVIVFRHPDGASAVFLEPIN